MKKNIDILSTRDLDEAILQKAADNGFTIDCLPFIQTVPVDSDELSDRIAALSVKHIPVVFTSRKAIDAILPYLERKPVWKIFCTGGATKELAIQTFGERAIVATARNASELKDKLMAEKDLTDIVFFCGNQRLTNLPETLREHGIAVDEVVVYETIPVEQFVQKDYPGILFFSPSAAHSFFSGNTIHTDVVLFSIGHTTTNVIHSYCANKIITSQWPGQESLLDLVIHYPW